MFKVIFASVDKTGQNNYSPKLYAFKQKMKLIIYFKFLLLDLCLKCWIFWEIHILEILQSKFPISDLNPEIINKLQIQITWGLKNQYKYNCFITINKFILKFDRSGALDICIR